jgi:hypothetical protein
MVMFLSCWIVVFESGVSKVSYGFTILILFHLEVVFTIKLPVEDCFLGP